MKQALATMLAALLAISAAGVASAEVTLRIVSTFAGTDIGAAAYNDLLAAWEERTGNKVDDTSSTSDEAWKAGVLNDFAAGNEADVLFYFAANADSAPILSKVVPISEVNEAYPGLNLPENELLREPDGNVYAIAVRPFWEAMFVNTDLFEAYDLALPTDVETFETAVATFRANGIVPIAVSLSDIPHYIAEISILSCGPVADHLARPATMKEVPASWIQGTALIRHLYEIGAFPDNVNSTTEELTTAMFRNKEAAMLLDGSWAANGIIEANWNSTIVMPFPAYADDADPTAILGGTSMGFYITRKVWEDELRRDAAVDLLVTMTSDEAKAGLGYLFGGRLLESSQEMLANAEANGAINSPFQDTMDSEARMFWLGQISGIADGSQDPAALWAEVISRGAFPGSGE